MSLHGTRRDRRRFIRLALGGVIAAPIGALVGPRDAPAAERPKLDPDSEQARKLAYTRDTASSDHPQREQGASCRNCAHFRGGRDDTWAPCSIFPEHRVSADGWCTAWYPKG